MTSDKTLIAPSILASDFANLAEECRKAKLAGADWLHLDVMDGHFVPNISFGPAIVKAVDGVSDLPLDVHLMIERPDRYLNQFLDAGADTLSIQVEAPVDIPETLARIRQKGCRAGLVINPPTAFKQVEPFLGEIDLLLVMTVHPGFGGQSFMEECVDKVRRAAEIRHQRGLRFDIEVDGGINPATGATCVRAGANVLVAGTSVFGAGDYAEAIHALRDTAAK
jgi:ribulose-phosphate 3-epimerase